jgi:Uma2 family endonuclease
LFIALTAEIERHRSGQVWMSPIDVILDREKHLVVQPDLIVMSNDRLDLVSDRVYGAPDLVVEVLSPHPRIGALHERLSWFAQYGVRECWLIEQMTYEVEVLQFANRTVASRRMFAEEEPIQSVVLPRFDQSLQFIAGHGR